MSAAGWLASGVPKGKGFHLNAGHVSPGPYSSLAAAKRVEPEIGSKKWPAGSVGTFIVGQRGTGNVFEGSGRLADVMGLAEQTFPRQGHAGPHWVQFP